VRLKDVLKNIDYEIMQGDTDIEISGIYYDSRNVRPGSLFVCISGFKTDGHLYAQQAVNNGAIAVIAEKKLDIDQNTTYILVDDSRKVLSDVASNYYGQPSRYMRVIGVTGTNGKTTTTHLIKAILEEAGEKVGIMGTLYARIGDAQKEMGHTTPEALEIEEFMCLSKEQGASYVVMEVSSHALDLNRTDRIDFNAAIFTNLTQDHLDFHEDMDNYVKAKLKLFQMIVPDKKNFTIVNADDKYALNFIQASRGFNLTYSINHQADVQAVDLNIDLNGSRFTVKYNEQSFDVNMKLIGLFSVYNALAAIAFALREGISSDIIKAALEKVDGVPGRFEQVRCGQKFTVVVDYAHTPDGLENILKTGRQLTDKRLITVFGCGGDRDRTKRPLMGEIAAQFSDFCVVTSDNPRSEEPVAIIDDIVPGLNKVKNSRYAIIVDRREAIQHAIYLARPGDLVIIAGKGHETYQIIKDRILDFDDRKVVAEFIKGKEK